MTNDTTLNLLFTKANNKKKTRTIDFVNPQADDSKLNAFAKAFAELSNSTLDKVLKVKKHDLLEDDKDFVIVRDNSTLITGGADDDVILLSGNNITVNAGAGNNTIYGNGGGNTYYHNAGANETVFGFTDKDSVELRDSNVMSSVKTNGGLLITDYADSSIFLKGNVENINLAQSPFETLVITSATDAVTIASNNVVSVKAGTADTVEKKPRAAGARFGTFNASGGTDTITVNEGVTGMSIYGGRGNDSINIIGHGNTYVYTYGDGNDTISGWGANDTLYFSDWDGWQPSMSADGDNFKIKVGSGSITFSSDTKIGDTIHIQRMGGTTSDVTVTRLMLGTAAADTLVNTETGKIKSGTASEAWTMDGGNGNDYIVNSGDYISISGGIGNDYIVNSGDSVTIDGGAGNDSIVIQAGESGVTKGVSIYGGGGADSINVINDAVGSVKGAHVYYYQVRSNNKVSIAGFNGNDSIVVGGLTDFNYRYLALKSAFDKNAARVDNYKLNFDNNNAVILQDARNSRIQMFDADRDFAVVPAGEAVVEGNDTHYVVPNFYYITSDATITPDYSGATISPTDKQNIDVEADFVTIQGSGTGTLRGKGVCVEPGSNSSYSLIGGTNVDSLGIVDSDNPVTICNGLASIDAQNDFKVVDGQTVRATHLYQSNSGYVYVLGATPADSVQVTSSPIICFYHYSNGKIILQAPLIGNTILLLEYGKQELPTVLDFNGDVAVSITSDNGTYFIPANHLIASSATESLTNDISDRFIWFNGTGTGTSNLITNSADRCTVSGFYGVDNSGDGVRIYLANSVNNSGNNCSISAANVSLNGASNCSISGASNVTIDSSSGGNYFCMGNQTINNFNLDNDILYGADDTTISTAVSDSGASIRGSGIGTVVLPGVTEGSIKIKSSDNLYQGTITVDGGSRTYTRFTEGW